MTWFKVDDQFHDHWKAESASVDAIGLWVLAGSWCGGKRNGGFVPKRLLRRWFDDLRAGEAAADSLIAVGLWEVAEDEQEPGWWFHDWEDYNPTTTADELHAARSAAGRKGGLASGQARREANVKQVASSNEASASEATKQTKPPDPVPVPKKTSRAPRSDLDTDPDFIAFWSAYPRREGKGDAKKAWPRALAKASAGELITAAKAYAERTRDTERQYIKTPAAWLNAERWADDQPSSERRFTDPSMAWMNQ